MAENLLTGKNALLLMAGGALGTLGLLALAKSDAVRPLLVGAAKEGVSFKEWLAANFEKAKEDLEDIIAEGAYEHESEAAAEGELKDREAELIAKVEELLAKVKEKGE